MKLHNTLTHQTEPFTPIEPGHVKMYNCGPTVYGDQHVGNYRTFAFADILRRYFEYKGWKVTQIINITDVGHLTQDDIDSGEDKIDVMARKMGWTAIQVAEHFMNRFYADRKTLLMREPAKFTRATEHIPPMIDLIQRLLDKGVAYKVGGNVYFDVSRFPAYGKLSGNTLDAIKSGESGRVGDEVKEKRHPADFALWKTDAKHLMQWDAPWGRGFPGWHIECSAMSMQYLGETFDLHTGGEDNIFPHHEAEIAQAEAATGHPFVKVWMHARHMLWDGLKISKSLGNVILVEDMLKKGYTPQEIRYTLVSTRYSQRVNFSWQSFDDSRKALGYIVEFRRRLQDAAKKPAGAATIDLEKHRRDFEARMDDDLDVAGAIGVLQSFRNDGNRAIDQGLGGEAAQKALALLERFGDVFGILPPEADEAVPPEVIALANARLEARKRKDFKAADDARDKIKAMGWSVEDTKDGMKFKKL
ncbi:MAG TPA: cysteine--tRNA ligase [Planctomycetota bacterium]|nr:cysteine--tRNA ligase [Planctomycetota bacterium]